MAFIVPMLMFETASSRPELPIAIYVAGTVQFLLPSLGLAFFGAACWWRSRWLAMLGLYALIPLALLLAIALIRS
jgi:hypothetical protein